MCTTEDNKYIYSTNVCTTEDNNYIYSTNVCITHENNYTVQICFFVILCCPSKLIVSRFTIHINIINQ